MRNKNVLCNKIQHFRQENGLTQEELAEKVGLSRGAITLIEQGKRKVTAEELIKFCQVFNCSYNDFFSIDTSNEKNKIDPKRNVRELYDAYKAKYQTSPSRSEPSQNPLDDYLRQVNPYYYPTSNNEIRYEQRTEATKKVRTDSSYSQKT